MGVREFLTTFAAAKQNFVTKTKDETLRYERRKTKDEKRKRKRELKR